MILDSDRLFLEAAVGLARRGLHSTTPNPPVGCLIVRDGRVLGRGWHVRPGEGHAEVNALADAAGQDVRGATAYVSLEPCAFHGRTPPCSQALIKAGISRVVAAMTDPHPKVQGQGFAQLRAAGIAVDLIELETAGQLIEGYVSRVVKMRPFVRVKIAASLDGRTAMASGESRWITSEAARADVQAWRARSCAIVTGSETVLADDPAMTVRDPALGADGTVRQPLRVVLDSRLRIPAAARIFEPPGEVLVVHTHGDLPATSRADSLKLKAAADGRINLGALMPALAELGINELLVEAGPTLAGAFIAAGLWDELLIYLAPKLLGSDGRPLAGISLARMADAIEATIVDRAAVGPDVRLRLRPVAGSRPDTGS